MKFIHFNLIKLECVCHWTPDILMNEHMKRLITLSTDKRDYMSEAWDTVVQIWWNTAMTEATYDELHVFAGAIEK